jgi:hypothetical protein
VASVLRDYAYSDRPVVANPYRESPDAEGLCDSCWRENELATFDGP